MSLWIAMWLLDFMGSNLQGNIPPFRSLMKPFRDFLNKILMNLWMFAKCSDIVFWKVMKIHEGFSCLKARLVNKISVNALASVFAQKFSLEASKHWISGWIWHPLWCDGRHGCLFVWRLEYLVYLVCARCGRMVAWFRSIPVSVCTIRAEFTYLWKILQTKMCLSSTNSSLESSSAVKMPCPQCFDHVASHPHNGVLWNFWKKTKNPWFTDFYA